MTKEQKIQEYESKQLIDELSKMPPIVIATAYLHAINYTLYGEDVTEKWVTATQNAHALEKAHRNGYYEALQKVSALGMWIPLSKQLPEDGTWNFFTNGKQISVERYKADAIDHFYPDGRWFSFEDAIAWMPLPELPKVESEV